MFQTEITIDPFTGLPNLFELLESAPLITYGVPGSAIAFDIDHLTNINEAYGRQSGDHCIKLVADLLRNESALQKRPHLANVFRTGGDEFLLILPLKAKKDAEHLATDLRKRFRSMALQNGLLGANLHTAVVSYGEKGISAHHLLKSVRLGLSNRNTAFPDQTLPLWADQLIDTMVDRICETLNLLRQTRFLALNDEISGLPNHRAADLFILDMLQKYQLHKKPCSLLFIDGDNLKQYNNLGYQQGNQMIRELSRIIANSLRQDDQAARWLSGDEFIVVLPNTDRNAAFQIGERIRSAVESATAGWSFPVTISIGVSNCPEDGTNAETLIAIAETANSRAKRSGKNQVS